MRAAIIVGSACLLLAGAAQAASADASSRRLETRNVDFNDARSVDRFYKRLLITAREVCDSHVPYDVNAIYRDRDCVTQTVDQIVNRVQRPLLTARRDDAMKVRYATGY